ncbi:uncharacterized protein F5147DRAFT_767483 [Suillus discolor]|uniref:Uncharacterized protein n=1 Tax=Suillus discolor TaxID=1912936 RepID=A0A9P7JZV8_9AGAM|nr:uncharacterized protein F5147DRAFT_767483 [Suillus discolor]KAG2118718.1 hypothetical protein F5147DRAFT_767483 [Suillus discolor]
MLMIPSLAATRLLTAGSKCLDGFTPLTHAQDPHSSPVDRWRQAIIKREDIIRLLRPLVGRFSTLILSAVRVQQAAKGSSVANQIIQTGIATIIVLEYSAFLPNHLGDLERVVESAVDYYLKSPTAVAVEKGAKEISRQGYDREELGKKILEFILENRLSKDLTEKK